MTYQQATKILKAIDNLSSAIGQLPTADHAALTDALHAKDVYVFTDLAELEKTLRRAQFQDASAAFVMSTITDTNPVTI